MLSIDPKDARTYCKGGDNTLAASVAYAFASGSYTFTDNTVYASGDSRRGVNISVFDNFGTKKEVQIPAGSTTATLPLTGNKVGSLRVTAGGTGYTSAPAVAFSGGGGSGATGVAYISGGVVIGIELTNGGNGYTSAPTVALTGGGGSGATAAVTIGTDRDLNRTEGISMIATVVSTLGKVKDGSVHHTFTDSGNFNMEL